MQCRGIGHRSQADVHHEIKCKSLTCFCSALDSGGCERWPIQHCTSFTDLSGRLSCRSHVRETAVRASSLSSKAAHNITCFQETVIQGELTGKRVVRLSCDRKKAMKSHQQQLDVMKSQEHGPGISVRHYPAPGEKAHVPALVEVCVMGKWSFASPNPR
jgi:hypothetical protein